MLADAAQLSLKLAKPHFIGFRTRADHEIDSTKTGQELQARDFTQPTL